MKCKLQLTSSFGSRANRNICRIVNISWYSITKKCMVFMLFAVEWYDFYDWVNVDDECFLCTYVFIYLDNVNILLHYSTTVVT